MSSPLILSIDAMGGDHAPEIIIDGLVHFFKNRKRTVKILLHGDQVQLDPLLAAHEDVRAHCDVRHTDQEVDMSAKPSEAVRRA